MRKREEQSDPERDHETFSRSSADDVVGRAGAESLSIGRLSSNNPSFLLVDRLIISVK